MIWRIVLAALVAGLTEGQMLFLDNHTMCPCSDPYAVFEGHGVANDWTDLDLTKYNPILLHEECVLHLVNHRKQFKLVGVGGNAHVYLGQLRNGQRVIVKTLTESSYETLIHEARIYQYLQDISYVPRIFGIVPTGTALADLSLVVEYLENSTSVEELLTLEHLASECNWVDISLQVSNALLEIHNKLVLFNDLHLNNIIVVWKGNAPNVHIIDFGHATFKRGKSYTSHHLSSREEFDFLPPEVWFDVSAPQSDVFSLGAAFIEISKHIQSEDFRYIANKCMSINPQNRPTLTNIRDFLKDLHSLKCPETHVSGRQTSVKHDISVYENYTDIVGVPLPLIDWSTFKLSTSGGEYNWVHYSEQTQIAFAHHKQTDMPVVIKMFEKVNFEDIRHEAAMNFIMNSTMYIPRFLGVTFSGPLLENLCLVQECFGNGNTLSDLLETIEGLDFTVKLVLALELANALVHFHGKGVTVNNFKTDNILVDFVDNYPSIRLIDIGKSSFRSGYLVNEEGISLDSVEYIAPESKKTLMTSYASDIYSLGVILRNIFTQCDHKVVSELIFKCLDHRPCKRPSAAVVVATLLGVLDVDKEL